MDCLSPCLLHHAPDPLDGVEGTAVGRQQPLLKVPLKLFFHDLGNVNREVIHDHHNVKAFAHGFEVRYEPLECLFLVASREDLRMDDSPLGTERTDESDRGTSGLRDSYMHAFFDPDP